MYFVPQYINKTKENSKKLKHKRRYTITITQTRDQEISIKHAVDFGHSIIHFIRGNESRNTHFINGTNQLEALLVIADY
jgi:hypothetical protein